MKYQEAFLIILLLVFCLPSSGHSQSADAEEDGWKNLKWGMTLQEVKDNYVNDINVDVSKWEKCEEMSEEPIFTTVYMEEFEKMSIYSEMRKVTNVSCDGHDADIRMYKGKFVSKVVDLRRYVFNDDVDTSLQSQLDTLKNILNKLKKKYPKGQISYIEQKNFQGIIYKYPTFTYHSDKIAIYSGKDPNRPSLSFLEATYDKMKDEEIAKATKTVEEEQRKANAKKTPF